MTNVPLRSLRVFSADANDPNKMPKTTRLDVVALCLSISAANLCGFFFFFFYKLLILISAEDSGESNHNNSVSLVVYVCGGRGVGGVLFVGI